MKQKEFFILKWKKPHQAFITMKDLICGAEYKIIEKSRDGEFHNIKF
jgi:hypothetical protein